MADVFTREIHRRTFEAARKRDAEIAASYRKAAGSDTVQGNIIRRAQFTYQSTIRDLYPAIERVDYFGTAQPIKNPVR